MTLEMKILFNRITLIAGPPTGSCVRFHLHRVDALHLGDRATNLAAEMTFCSFLPVHYFISSLLDIHN